MRRVLSSVTSLLVLLALVPGGAIALVHWGRGDLLFSIEWSGILSRPDDGSLVLLALTVLGWVAWAMLTGSVVAEALSAVSHGRISVRLPGSRLFGPAAAVLVASIAGLIGVQSAATNSAPCASVSSTSAAVSAESVAGEGPAAATPLAAADAQEAPSRDSRTDSAATSPRADSQWHQIVSGDDLWTLAEHYYGAGEQWRDIVGANATLGLSAVDALPVGVMIEIPGATVPDALQDTAVPEGSHASEGAVANSTVQLLNEEFGAHAPSDEDDPDGVAVLSDGGPDGSAIVTDDDGVDESAEPSLDAGSPDDPGSPEGAGFSDDAGLSDDAGPATGTGQADEAGQPDAGGNGEAAVPAEPPASPDPSGAGHGGGDVVVAPGDTLWQLAETHLGGGAQWPLLAAANAGEVPQPDLIHPGQRLVLPAVAPGQGPATTAGSQPAGPQRADLQLVDGTGTGARAVVPGNAGGDAHAAAPDEVARAGGVGADADPAAGEQESRDHAVADASSGTARAHGPASESAGEGHDAASQGSSGEETSAREASSDEAGASDIARWTGVAESATGEEPAQQAARDGAVLSSQRDVRNQVLSLVGPIGAASAAAVLGVLGLRRRWQLNARPLGRRRHAVGADSARAGAALAAVSASPGSVRGMHGAPGADDVADVLEIYRPGARSSSLDRSWPDEPVGRLSTGDRGDPSVIDPATGGLDGVPHRGDIEAGGPGPDDMGPEDMDPDDPAPDDLGPGGLIPQDAGGGAVQLGVAGDDPVRLDLASLGVLAVSSPDTELVTGLFAAMAVQLSANQAVAEVHVPPDCGWLERLEAPNLLVAASEDDLAARLAALVAHRSGNLPPDRDADVLRLDPELRDAWLPAVFFLHDPCTESPEALRRLGIAVVCHDDAHECPLVLGEDRARWRGTEFTPDLVMPPARRAIVELLDAADDTDYEEAWWWRFDGDGDPHAGPPAGADVPLVALPTVPATSLPEESTVLAPPIDAPFLKILGPVELVNTRGRQPSRAVRQCQEYCAWILHHPGSNAVRMTRDLLIADTTRRSNMSRLRAWLGADEAGEPYLPDAYTGHIALHPGVSSDWEQLQLLISVGVNKAGDEALVAALSMVRGAPLADAAPGEWRWAEELRTDMVCTIRDIGVTLGERGLAAGNVDLARWAAARALSAAPEDEMLLRLRLRSEHLAGNRFEVERLVLHITRHARLLGVDLQDETVELLQEVMEGQARARLA
ncbi:LysM peptidoglycan-binding domain-containing protein [Propionibacterium freudenreichii]|uniref:LysM peptidoglycan-binding domain-containing protein n=1 Tax=Propionibacterium freudenreichii TaxID=1744 RepID=UPI00254A7353|nr:LysM peptidoglycan-binding domain-containing protein [Propionibacterium freudenreichii]MDK9299490.1 LysM peptidoglycan-binding domain-containing protein [Propionibacterium freudenreichii]